MPRRGDTIVPHDTQQETSIRGIYIQNLTDLLHVCLLRGEFERARRAWAILIRCRELDWRSRWNWGLLFLEASGRSNFSLPATQSGYSQTEGEGREAERWLKSLRVSAREVEKPALLHALVLHLIKHERYRAALDELETYLTSYPYLTSGPLHTYAGLLSFFLAQPVSQRLSAEEIQGRAASVDSTSTSSPPRREASNASMIRSARAWFTKAAELDGKDDVAREFLRLIDDPAGSDDDSVIDGKDDRKVRDASDFSDNDSDIDLEKIYNF